MKPIQTRTLALGQMIHQLCLLEKQPFDVPEIGLVTPSEFHLIDALNNQPKTGKELCQNLQITKGAVSQLTERLISKGWLIQTPSPTDKRSILYSLTESGKKIAVAHFAIAQQFHQHLTTQFSSADMQTIDAGFKTLADYLKTLLEENSND
ncbi:MAG: MarR family winged helix-turn-helix transcriptional regulator [Brochothrix thermosphacta]|uniref:MarR family winged helix-turn-helix transcriptional regulator n=1 Tax=Brochothrix thermosphacta TaxID=2756 RepID=UPI003F906C40